MPGSQKSKGTSVHKKSSQSVANSLNNKQKLEVQRLIGKDLQTKYAAGVAQILRSPPVPVEGYGVNAFTISGGGTFNAYNMIQPVDVGAAQNQRIGTKIHTVKLHTDFQFYLNRQASDSQNYAADYTVKMWIVKAKEIKDANLAITLPAATLFNLGNGTSGDWSYVGDNALSIADQTQAMLPIDTESWTVLKTHTFRLCKNQDAQQGGTGLSSAPNLTAHQSKNIGFTYKHKGALLYQESPTTGYLLPTNLAIMCFAVVYQTSGAPWVASSVPVLVNTRNHISFKNA